MDSKKLLEVIKDLYEALCDLETKGLAGRIKLTQLNRAIKKLGGHNNLPKEIAHITKEKLDEIRQANLISLAEVALDKAKDTSLDDKQRSDQIKWAAHYLEKANCGWQAIGFSQQEYIRLEFSIKCEALNQDSDSHFSILRQSEDISIFIKKLYHDGLVTEEMRDEFLETISSKTQRLSDEFGENIAAGFKKYMEQVEAGELSGLEAEESFEKIARMYRGYKRDEALTRLYDEAKTKYISEMIRYFDVQYTTIKNGEVGEKLLESLESLEKELDLRDLSWDDLNADDLEQIKENSLVCLIGSAIKTAQEQFENSQYSKAFETLHSLLWQVPAENWTGWKRTESSFEEFKSLFYKSLKEKLKTDFHDVANGDKPAEAKLSSLFSIENQMARFGLKWTDIDASKEHVDEILKPLNIEVAESCFKRYVDTKSTFDLHSVADYLGRAKADWDALEKPKSEIQVIVSQNGHDLPEIRPSFF